MRRGWVVQAAEWQRPRVPQDLCANTQLVAAIGRRRSRPGMAPRWRHIFRCGRAGFHPVKINQENAGAFLLMRFRDSMPPLMATALCDHQISVGANAHESAPETFFPDGHLTREFKSEVGIACPADVVEKSVGNSLLKWRTEPSAGTRRRKTARLQTIAGSGYEIPSTSFSLCDWQKASRCGTRDHGCRSSFMIRRSLRKDEARRGRARSTDASVRTGLATNHARPSPATPQWKICPGTRQIPRFVSRDHRQPKIVLERPSERQR